jgi:uncharacterized delta-60 repeat protein
MIKGFHKTKTSLAVRTRMFLFLFLTLSPLIYLSQAGTLDNTFGTNGIVMQSVLPKRNIGIDQVIRTDGKILMLGYYQDTSWTGAYYNVLRCYNPDGSLNSSFGINGTVTHSIVFGRAMALQGDGKIIAIGDSGGYHNPIFTIWRYLPDGSLDASFGNGGMKTTRISDGDDYARRVIIQPDGKYLVAGESIFSSSNSLSFVRYNQDGSLDVNFGVNGILTTTIGVTSSSYPALGGLFLQTDGKIIAGCNFKTATGNGYSMGIIRYNTDGSFDNTFGLSGITTNTSIGATCLLLQPDSKILCVGPSWASAGTQIERFNPNGSLDNFFGSNGLSVITTSLRPECSYLQPDGKIMVVGWIGSLGIGSLALTSCNPDGSTNTSFGNNGLTTTDVTSGYETPHSTIMQQDGKILVTGEASDTQNNVTYFLLARYNSGLQIGIKENSKDMSGVSAYPNPFTEKLKLSFLDSILSASEVFVYSNTGSLVYKQVVKAISEELDLDFLSKGIYYLRIVQSDQIRSIKISKE